MGNIGFPEMIVIFVIALLVFGPKRLPELGRSLGRGISEFRKASTDLKGSIEREIQTLESEASASEFRKASSELKDSIERGINTLESEASAAMNSKAPEEGAHLDDSKS